MTAGKLSEPPLNVLFSAVLYNGREREGILLRANIFPFGRGEMSLKGAWPISQGEKKVSWHRQDDMKCVEALKLRLKPLPAAELQQGDGQIVLRN